MPIKLLLVDDEEDILSGMRDTVEWNSIDATVCGCAKNGREALGIIDAAYPDVVITDIRMPEMDGLKLCEYIYCNHPRVKTIILSGYADFEYARQALEYNVTEYLLKPVDINHLLTTVSTLKERIYEEKDTLVEKIILCCINNQIIEKEQLICYLEENDLYLDKSLYILVNITISHRKRRSSVGISTDRITNYFRSLLIEYNLHGYLVIVKSKMLSVIIEIQNDSLNLSTLLRRWKQQILDDLGLRTKYGVSNYFNSIFNIPEAYDQASKALARLFVEEEKDTSFFHKRYENRNRKQYKRYYGEVIRDIYEDNWIINKQTINHCFESIEQSNIFEETTIKDVIRCILFSIVSYAIKMNVYGKVSSRYFDILMEVNSSTSLKSLKKTMTDFVRTVDESINNHKEKSRNTLVEKVREYVEANYHYDLGVKEVAKVLKRSPNYISHMFKKEVGKRFTEFLNEVRIEKAMGLLKQTDYKLYHIAREVGYKDSRYFIKVFKRIVKITPTDYRKLWKKYIEKGENQN